jgi:hypothetical protein
MKPLPETGTEKEVFLLASGQECILLDVPEDQWDKFVPEGGAR